MGLNRWELRLGLAVAMAAVSGCGAGAPVVRSASAGLEVRPGAAVIDTNCTGCNARSPQGATVEQMIAGDAFGNADHVEWSVSGGDPVAGAGTISRDGRYTPPSYLTGDRAEVLITARLLNNARVSGRTVVTVTPGFLAPLEPQNAAVAPGGSVKVSARLAQTSGVGNVQFLLAGGGTLSAPVCEGGGQKFTTCAATYTAPSLGGAGQGGAGLVRILASAGQAKTEAAVLVNEAGVSSNPGTHQVAMPMEISLGTSGGNNTDFDAHGTRIADCCSGTLGALVQDGDGQPFILSNNHVLARSDRAAVGDAIVQPGLIDNNCTPYGEGPGTAAVAWLTSWLPLSSPQTNVDAAIAQVGSRTVSAYGEILELGPRQANGELASAAPGVSSSGGKGEAASLGMQVAKSGRTTGLTCGEVDALDVDVSVDYYKDCAETLPYLTKRFSHQFAMSGGRFSDAGDSGALVVDAANAEPVGLLFASGMDAAGVSHAMANPAGEVLSELGTRDGASYSYLGGADHAVSCLSYGDEGHRWAQAAVLSDAQIAAGNKALKAAEIWAAEIGAADGRRVLQVKLGKSSDHPGQAAVLVYLDKDSGQAIPQTFAGVRTVDITATAHEVAMGTAPLLNNTASSAVLSKEALRRAVEVKDQVAGRLLNSGGIFAIGVGASFDHPGEAALVIFADRNRMPREMPTSISGVRTRYIVMDRLHVTRSFLAPRAPACTVKR